MNESNEKTLTSNNEGKHNENESKIVKIRGNVSLKLPNVKALEEKIANLPESKKSDDPKENAQKFFRIWYGKDAVVPEIQPEDESNQEELVKKKREVASEYTSFLEKKYKEIQEKIIELQERFDLIAFKVEQKFTKLNILYPRTIPNDFVDGIKMRSEIIKNSLDIALMVNSFAIKKSMELFSEDIVDKSPLGLLTLMNETKDTLFDDQENKFNKVDQFFTKVEDLFVYNNDYMEKRTSRKEARKIKESVKGTVFKN